MVQWAAPETTPPMAKPPPPPAHGPASPLSRLLLAATALVALLAVTASMVTFQQARSAARDTLGAVAELRVTQIEAWLEMVATSYNVLPMDAATFRAWAQLMHRRSDTVYEDAMIAATAKVHGLTVVTRNVADFKPFGVPLLNPFKA